MGNAPGLIRDRLDCDTNLRAHCFTEGGTTPDIETKKNGENLKPYWFKPGISGNPKGRPPVALSLTDLHRQGLGKKVPKEVMEILSAFIFGKKRLPKDWLKIELTWGEAWVMQNLFRGVLPREIRRSRRSGRCSKARRFKRLREPMAVQCSSVHRRRALTQAS
jgi:hypothetical protein